MKSRICPDPQPELSLRGNGNPPIEAVIENHFPVALSLYDGNNVTRTSFSENITFIIITVIVASAAGGDDKKETGGKRWSMLSTFHSSATAHVEQFVMLLKPDVPVLKSQQMDWESSLLCEIFVLNREVFALLHKLFYILVAERQSHQQKSSMKTEVLLWACAELQ